MPSANRTVDTTLCDGRHFSIAPDAQVDFTALPFPDNSFPLVVFDPPHLRQAGSTGWLSVKYGVLPDNWQDILRQGFEECFRVLVPFGTLVFKWSEDQVRLRDVLSLTDRSPLFGNRRGKTIWVVFQNDRMDCHEAV
ncbi:MAG: SAM-dependent methyltransferase [Desulfovibrio sp.]|jgi:hypothetical protein|nr:SAM-dependent methyltransferase [Desulfovibrio sp.]